MSPMKKIWLFFFLLSLLLILSVTRVQAQSVLTGEVTSRSGSPLPYASVTIIQDSIEKSHAICDSLGRFRVNLPENARKDSLFIQARYLKYISSSSPINNDLESVHIIIDDPRILTEAIVVSQGHQFIRSGDRFVFSPDKSLTSGSSAIDLIRHCPMIQFDMKTDLFSIINRPGTIVYINN